VIKWPDVEGWPVGFPHEHHHLFVALHVWSNFERWEDVLKAYELHGLYWFGQLKHIGAKR
jgi:hypothetical protein